MTLPGTESSDTTRDGTAGTEAPAALRLEGITKRFPGVLANDDVTLEVRKGEILGLLGENGAGKTTLMNIVYGLHEPDGGRIVVDGREVEVGSPQDAMQLGIGMVHQHFMLVPDMTVAENVALSSSLAPGLTRLPQVEARLRELARQFGLQVEPDALVEELSLGGRQRVEIVKLLYRGANLLILDEPTAALTPPEWHELALFLRSLADQGRAIVFITHKLDELFGLVDRCTVLRDGRVVITEAVPRLTMERVIEQIVGRRMEQAFAWKERRVDRSGNPLLEVSGLSSGRRVRDVSFNLYPGEILGLAGLMGSGRTELARALFGIDKISSGTVKVRGKPVAIHSPDDALAAGICLVPEDRRLQGLVLDHTVKDNLLLPLLGRIQQGGMINDQRGNQLVESFVRSLRVKTDSIYKQVRLLSGGNQQKVVIAKWLAYEPDILIMDEPTAGIDIGAKTEILDVIRGLADGGKGVIVISSELTELLAVSDRVVVLRNGVSKRELMRQEIQTEEMLHHVVQTA
jgi:ribose transport system ATP-binding protein